MSHEIKRIALFPGLDGTGHLLHFLKAKLSDIEVDIINYDESLTSLIAIVADVEDRFELASYTHFFAESFGTLVLSQSLAKKQLADRPCFFLAPFLQIPLRFQLMLNLPDFLIKKTYKRILATPLLSHYCLGKWSNPKLKDSVNNVISELDPIIMLRRLRTIKNIVLTESVFANSIVIKTQKDRLIPVSQQEDFADKFGCGHQIIIEAPHFAALSHSTAVAEIINSI